MVLKKFIYGCLLLCFFGALALTTVPSLHERQHHSLAKVCPCHSSQDSCKVCHILGYFSYEGAIPQIVLFVPQEFLYFRHAHYHEPLVSHLFYALIPRAPPVLS